MGHSVAGSVTMKGPLPPWFPLEVAVISVVPALVAITLVGQGWRNLQANFATRMVPEGTAYNGVSLSVGAFNYKGCIFGVVTPAGVYFRVWKMFAPTASPVFVPWESMAAGERKQLLWKSYYETLATPSSGGATARLSFSGAWSEDIERRHREFLSGQPQQSPGSLGQGMPFQ